MRHEFSAAENGRVEYLMVHLPWLTVLWSFLAKTGMLNILSIRFKLMIVTFTLLHVGPVYDFDWCNVLTRDVRSGALLATPRSCGFAALSHALRSRGVYFISYTCLDFGASLFGVLSKTFKCSLVWCVLFARFFIVLLLFVSSVCDSVALFFFVTPPSHPGCCPFAGVFRTWRVRSGRAPFFPCHGSFVGDSGVWLTTVPYGTRSFSVFFWGEGGEEKEGGSKRYGV